MVESIKGLEKGQIIEVVVKANASQNEILSFNDGVLKVAIKAVPEKGKANAELLKFLRKEAGRGFEIVSGFSSRKKRVKVV